MLEVRHITVGDLGKVVTGRTPPSGRPELLGEGPAFITPTDMDDGSIYARPQRRLSAIGAAEFQRVLLPANSVCFTCIASIGKMCMVREPSVTNQQINSIVVDTEHFDPRWVFYKLKEMRREIAGIASGSATPIINKTTFSSVKVAVPHLDTQRRIAGILGAYDDLIEVNRRQVAVLEAMARGLFEEWFVRFRFPGYEDVPFRDTPNGPLPEGWTWLTLGSLLRLVYGKALKSDERVPGEASVIGSSGVVGNHSEALVKGPGIVVGRKGNVGSVIWSHGDFWPIDTTYYVDTDLPLTFVEQLLRRIPFQNTDAAVPGLNRDYALSRVVTAPPRALIDQYGAFAGPLRNAVETIEASSRNLAASRDLLLPRLISGELSVEAAERQLEAAE